MVLDRADGHHELIGDLAVRQPGSCHAGDLGLTPCQSGGTEVTAERRRGCTLAARCAGRGNTSRCGCGPGRPAPAVQARRSGRRLRSEELRADRLEPRRCIVQGGRIPLDEAAGVGGASADERAVDDPLELMKTIRHTARLTQSGDVVESCALQRRQAPLLRRHGGGGQEVQGRRDPARRNHRPCPTADELGVHEDDRRVAFGVEVLDRIRCGLRITELTGSECHRTEAPSGPRMTEITEDHRCLASAAGRGDDPSGEKVRPGQQRGHPRLPVAIALRDRTLVPRDRRPRRGVDHSRLDLRHAEGHQVDPRTRHLDLFTQMDTRLERTNGDLDRRVSTTREHVRHRGLQPRLTERPVVAALEQRCHQLERCVDLAGEGRHHGALGDQFVEQHRIGDRRFGVEQHPLRLGAVAHPTEEIVRSRHRQHRPVAAGAGSRLGSGEHLLGLLGATHGIKRESQQVHGLVKGRVRSRCGREAVHRGNGEPSGHLQVAAQQRAPGTGDQSLRIGRLARVEPPRSEAHRVVAPAQPGGLRGVGQPQQQAVSNGLRHRGARDLGVDGMHRPELAASAVGRQLDEPCLQQLVDQVERARALERMDTHGLPQSNRIEQLSGLPSQAVQPLLHQLGQPWWGGDRTHQEPGRADL